MATVKQTQKELEEHLREQIDFLMSSADTYDSGKESESKRMAVHLRTLLHDTKNKDGSPRSQSLLGLLGLKDKIQFLDTALEAGNVGSYTGLVMQSIGPKGGSFVAPLDDLPPDYKEKKVGFNEYWNKEVFIDNKKNTFTRRDLVLAYANKDGGAHIDPELEQDYADLTKNNSLGWLYGNDIEWGPLQNPVSAAVRQITHEVIRSLEDDYPERKLLNKNGGIVFGGIRIVEGFSAGKLIQIPTSDKNRDKKAEKERKNKKCECGSGRKYRYCHSKTGRDVVSLETRRSRMD